ncbi:magnesium/cobalt transporter CorA [Dysgonomonas sp. 216]|uniref:magnesium/cobalt transporter CorA n=1 Tax=Dysgonomonas sp. 216 TaxID=2302934 RepID=UPI0013D09CE8|nr:magnesium/cobalt transporter CorA [Dysgonomonas sp. 216]
MQKKTTHKSYVRQGNTHLLQNLSYQGSYNVATEVEMIKFNEKEILKKAISEEERLIDQIKDGYVYWFKITGFSDVDRINRICNKFGIQRFDIKDLFSNLQVTKIVTYKTVTFIMMSGCFIDENDCVVVEQIAFILGKNYVISFQETSSPIFDGIITALNNPTLQIRNKGADHLLYFLLNCVHSGYNDIIGKTSEKLDYMEDKLINQDDKEDNNYVMRFLRKRRSDYSIIRRSVMPLREEYKNLLHNSNNLILDENIIYFDDFDDRLRTTLEELEIIHETLASLMDLYFNNNNQRMNEIIKRLTIVSTIFIPLTFMVGVWGMNFKYMPELDWEYGYYVSWITLVIIALIAILFLKRKGWF